MSLDDLKHAIGQKFTNYVKQGDSIWLYFETEVVIIRFPEIDCRCIDCADKFEEK